MQSLTNMIESANAAMSSGNLALAVQVSQDILKYAPDSPRAHYILGVSEMHKGNVKGAIKAFKRVQKKQPNDASLMNSLGSAYAADNKPDEALICFRQCVKLDPTRATAYFNMAILYKMRNQLEEAEVAFRNAVEQQPNDGDLLAEWGLLLQSMGKLQEANSAFLRAMKTNACPLNAQSMLLFNLNYCSGVSPLDMITEYQRWGERVDQSLAPRANDQLTALRLDMPLKRIGYVSPDFRGHAVARFFQPVLRAHDRSKYEIYCYFNDTHSDAMTDQLRGEATAWRDVAALSDEQLSQQIIADDIDILVDLAGHTRKNRLNVFARRAAPIQISWIGYPNTTGLSRMDYRITDAVADPAGAEAFCTERLLRLPGGFLTFSSDEHLLSNPQCPSERNRVITFGSFNVLTKVTSEVLDLWARLLLEIPDSRLLLKSVSLDTAYNRTRVIQALEQRGIAKQRLTLSGNIKSISKHLALYDEIDVALDSFPYGGTTTTCEALWMGVPVVTLSGATHASRVGASLLHRVGLDDLVAHNPDEYCSIARTLAYDVARRRSLREHLRSTVKASNLGDAQSFTRELETSFESVWQARNFLSSDLS